MNTDDPTEIFRGAKSLVESIMSKKWLNSRSRLFASHPAYKYWIACTDLISRGGHLTGADFIVLSHLTSLLIDCFDISSASGGDSSRLELSDFRDFRRRSTDVISRARSKNGNAFLELMTELSTFSFCRSNGINASPIVQDGAPDFLIPAIEDHTEILVECKHPQGRMPKALSRLVEKANRQIRETSDTKAGLLVVDLRSELGVLPLQIGSPPPDSVSSIADYTKSLLKGKFRSISRVLFSWDELMFKRSQIETNVTKVVFRRRCVDVAHPAPRVPLSEAHPLKLYGATIAFDVLDERPPQTMMWF